MGQTESQSSKGQEAVLNRQRPGEFTHHKGQRGQSNVHNGLIREDLWHWVINDDAPRSETDRRPKLLLQL